MFDTYTLAQAISRINVGYRNHRVSIAVPKTNLVEQALSLLKRNGLINSFSLSFDGETYNILLNLSNQFSKEFPTLKLVSKPSTRHYLKYATYNHNLRGIPFLIVSSKQGLISTYELSRSCRGGELLFILAPKCKRS